METLPLYIFAHLFMFNWGKKIKYANCCKLTMKYICQIDP